MFSDYGNVLSASIIFDRMSGRSKGFGFVELEDDEEAQKAISEMNGKDFEGRNIVVSVARPKEERPQRNFS
jgi:RNA recognition motif-containing protein